MKTTPPNSSTSIQVLPGSSETQQPQSSGTTQKDLFTAKKQVALAASAIATLAGSLMVAFCAPKPAVYKAICVDSNGAASGVPGCDLHAAKIALITGAVLLGLGVGCGSAVLGTIYKQSKKPSDSEV